MEEFPLEVLLTTHPEEEISLGEILCERCQVNPEHSLTQEEITEGECRKCGRVL